MKILDGAVFFLCMVILFFSSEAVSAQECKPSSIPASTSLRDNGNGTVTDLKTGLMWKQQQESGTFTWQQALKRAKEVNANGGFAGYSDWRVPNIRELVSIVEHQCGDPAINLAVFPDAVSESYWSSSPVAYNGSYAWVVSFYGGFGAWYLKASSYYVRLVRGGQ